jgi:hypothetical protein
MKNGQLKPGYSVNVAILEESITHNSPSERFWGRDSIKILAKSGEMWYSGKNTHWRIFGWKEKS